LLAQLARALEAAHAQGIIHRDIKPSNVIIHKSGQPKLSDFGLAKSLSSEQNLSDSGDLIGTPRYMSPEQALAAPQDIDARTDVYSLGAMMYEMLTGRPPVDGPNVLTVLRKLTDEEPPPVRELNPDVPDEVAAICRRAMAKDREARFATAGAFADAVEGYLAGRPATDMAATIASPALRRRAAGGSRPWQAVAVGAAVVALVALLGFLAMRNSGDKQPPPVRGAEQDLDTEGTADGDPAALTSKTGPLLGTPAPRPGPRAKVPLPAERVADVLKRASNLAEAPGRAGAATPRERWQDALAQLNSVLILYPASAEARFLRGRLRRQAGQYMGAVDDLNAVIRSDPKNLKAVSERLLANYELNILYLGHLSERLLRPLRPGRVQEDVKRLVTGGTPAQKHLAQVIDALARLDYEQAGKLAEQRPRPQEVRVEDLPDQCMVEADALFHAAEASNWAGQAEPRDQFLQKANAVLGSGLDANPNHVGLLFLKADTFHEPYAALAPDGEDAQVVARRQQIQFDAALNHLRTVASGGDAETAVGWVVLLFNVDRKPQALDRVNDALMKVPYMHAVRAWLRLQSPQENALTGREINRILHDFPAAFDTVPDDYNSYFVLALLHAAAGEWDAARLDLRNCKVRLRDHPLPTTDGTEVAWYTDANGPAKEPTTRYLARTLDILMWYVSVPGDLRIRLGEEVLQRLANAPLVKQEGIKPDEVHNLQATVHWNVARAAAGNNDKAAVFLHLEEALKLHAPGVTSDAIGQDTTFDTWRSGKDFQDLMKKHAVPPKK
jgi:tetratricopeptide (TPR) repeat protein